MWCGQVVLHKELFHKSLFGFDSRHAQAYKSIVCLGMSS